MIYLFKWCKACDRVMRHNGTKCVGKRHGRGTGSQWAAYAMNPRFVRDVERILATVRRKRTGKQRFSGGSDRPQPTLNSAGALALDAQEKLSTAEACPQG